jgi:hypothetical protein
VGELEQSHHLLSDLPMTSIMVSVLHPVCTESQVHAVRKLSQRRGLDSRCTYCAVVTSHLLTGVSSVPVASLLVLPFIPQVFFFFLST